MIGDCIHFLRFLSQLEIDFEGAITSEYHDIVQRVKNCAIIYLQFAAIFCEAFDSD
jgi:hypothetical protein